MNINNRSVITALVLGGLVAGGSNMAVAQDQRPGSSPFGTHVEHQMERLTRELKLTDEQRPRVKALLEESLKKRRQLATDDRVALEDRPEKMRALINQEDKKMKEILTADRYAKYKKMREQMQGGGDAETPPAESHREKKKD